jgi:hypothetical protein
MNTDTVTVEQLIKEIDDKIEQPFVTSVFGDEWRTYANKTLHPQIILDIAWKQGRRALLLEKALRELLAQRLTASPVSEEPEERYVWLNINNGEFSNSWNEEDQKYVSEESMERAREDGWKLIKYQCLTDDNVQFYNMMKVITSRLSESPSESKAQLTEGRVEHKAFPELSKLSFDWSTVTDDFKKMMQEVHNMWRQYGSENVSGSWAKNATANLFMQFLKSPPSEAGEKVQGFSREDMEKDLAIEIIARFSGVSGRNGRLTKARKKDFVDGALWSYDKLQKALPVPPAGEDWISELNKSGYAGCMRDGSIVDRRIHPEAVPVQQNSIFGIAKPKDL